MSTYSVLDPYATQVHSVNADVSVTEQTATLRPGVSDTSASLISLPEEKWHMLANINTVTKTPSTEDDEREYWDRATKSRIKDPHTRFVGHTLTMSVVNKPLLFDAIANAIPNPTSPETLAQLSAESEDGAPIFAANDPYVPVALRIEYYDGNGVLLYTEYLYAKIRATDAQEYNGKTQQPTITAEVQPSPHNRRKNTAAYTQQTVSN